MKQAVFSYFGELNEPPTRSCTTGRRRLARHRAQEHLLGGTDSNREPPDGARNVVLRRSAPAVPERVHENAPENASRKCIQKMHLEMHPEMHTPVRGSHARQDLYAPRGTAPLPATGSVPPSSKTSSAPGATKTLNFRESSLMGLRHCDSLLAGSIPVPRVAWSSRVHHSKKPTLTKLV